MRRFFRMLLLALVLLTVALVSALLAMQLAIHGHEVAIPRVMGMNAAEAERAGAATGLQVVVERQFYSPDVPEGKIITQVPAPGTKVRRGWSIRVAQSLGPQRVAIPDVTGGSERVADLNIRRRGLTLGSVGHLDLPDGAVDRVVSQSPPPNASGVSAPKINLLVSDGPDPVVYVMPNLTGQPLGSATLALQDAGMKVGRVSVQKAPLPFQPPGSNESPAESPLSTIGSQPSAASMVVAQSPSAGQKIVRGSTVNFEVR